MNKAKGYLQGGQKQLFFFFKAIIEEASGVFFQLSNIINSVYRPDIYFNYLFCMFTFHQTSPVAQMVESACSAGDPGPPFNTHTLHACYCQLL